MKKNYYNFFRYLDRVGTASSIFTNVVLGGASNQTLSARNWELKRQGQFNFVKVIDKLFWFEPNHCQISWVRWRIRTRSFRAATGMGVDREMNRVLDQDMKTLENDKDFIKNIRHLL